MLIQEGGYFENWPVENDMIILEIKEGSRKDLKDWIGK